MNENIIQMLPNNNLSFLYEVYRWGIDVIKVIQKMENPVLTGIEKFISALGTQYLYLLLILFIFWWVDEKQGLRLGILIMISAWINNVLKNAFKQPRPFNLDPPVGIVSESGYGIPSGHAQMSLTFWIPMAVWLGKEWVGKKPGRRQLFIWAGAVLLILLIGSSRLYLGVHFPTDVFAGWIIGGIVLVIWFIPGPILEKFFASAGARSQNISIAAIALVMNGLFPRDRTLAALFLGFCIGYTLMKSYFPFSARGEIKGKKPGVPVLIFRCVTGFLGVGIVYLALKLILPGEGSLFRDFPIWGYASPFYVLSRFVRYGLLGMWVSAGAPWVFQHMGLASVPGENGEDKTNPEKKS